MVVLGNNGLIRGWEHKRILGFLSLTDQREASSRESKEG